MKKLTALMLLIIHLLNIAGQLALHQYLVYKSDIVFNKQIGENHYNVNDLTEIRLQIKLPGLNNWAKYQNIFGRVQFKNSAYNYVKIKITESAVYLMCIPNYDTTHLADQNIIYARQISDIPIPKKDHVPFGKLNLENYSYQPTHYWFYAPAVYVSKITHCNHLFFINSSISGPAEPPDEAA